MSITIASTTALTEERRNELLACIRDGSRPSPVRPGAGRPLAVAVVANETDARFLAAAVPGAVVLGVTRRPELTRRQLLSGGAAAVTLVALPGGLTGCTPEAAEVVAQLIFLTIFTIQAVYEVLEEICGGVIIENPDPVPANNIGMDLGLVDTADVSDLAGQSYGEFSAFMQGTLRGFFDIPAASEFVLEFCDIRAEYASFFWLAGALLDRVISTDDALEVTEPA